AARRPAEPHGGPHRADRGARHRRRRRRAARGGGDRADRLAGDPEVVRPADPDVVGVRPRARRRVLDAASLARARRAHRRARPDPHRGRRRRGDRMMLALLGIAIAVLLVLRVPVAFAFLGPSLLYMWVSGQSVGNALRAVVTAADSFPMLAVPLFVLLGSRANHAGIADRLFRFALAVLARVRGSLGYVSIGTSVGFSWMSGSAVADAAALGKVQIP